MKTTIGEYDAATRDVPVTFTSGDIVHDRRVNACLDKDGAYDAAATKARVAQVALGVAAKIDVGAITNAPEPEPVTEEAAPDQPAA